MIFVALGIGILIISFVFALLSLLREQKTVEKRQNLQGDTNHLQQPSAPAIPKAEPITLPQVASTVQPHQERRVIETNQIRHEPFPWEEPIEKASDSTGVVNQNLWKNQPQEQQAEESPVGIGGEISLKDIPTEESSNS